MSAIEAVVFDFGGVFTTSPLENFARFEAERGLEPRFIGDVIKRDHHINAWARFERAEISLAEFDALFAAETRAAGYEIAGADLVALLSLRLKPEMAEALRRVKAAGLKTGCITNNLPGFEPGAMLSDPAERAAADAVFALFDRVIESSKAGVRKPEARIYTMMCEALGVPPGACAFLDDLGVNLKGAAAVGMRTIKVPLGDVRPAIRDLEAATGLALLD